LWADALAGASVNPQGQFQADLDMDGDLDAADRAHGTKNLTGPREA
jgi:hypothetical protein